MNYRLERRGTMRFVLCCLLSMIAIGCSKAEEKKPAGTEPAKGGLASFFVDAKPADAKHDERPDPPPGFVPPAGMSVQIIRGADTAETVPVTVPRLVMGREAVSARWPEAIL